MRVLEDSLATFRISEGQRTAIELLEDSRNLDITKSPEKGIL